MANFGIVHYKAKSSRSNIWRHTKTKMKVDVLRECQWLSRVHQMMKYSPLGSGMTVWWVKVSSE